MVTGPHSTQLWNTNGCEFICTLRRSNEVAETLEYTGKQYLKNSVRKATSGQIQKIKHRLILKHKIVNVHQTLQIMDSSPV